MKVNLLREGSRKKILENYKSLSFRTTAKIPGNGLSIVDFTVYFYQRGYEFDYLTLVEVTSLSSRSALYKMILNKHDMETQLDQYIGSYIRERNKLIPQLEKFTKLLALNRRNLYRSLEVNRSKGNVISESFSNQIKFSREKRGFLDKNYFEMKLVGHFSKKFCNQYCIVSVFRHIRLKLFRIKIFFTKTLKTYDCKFNFHDITYIMTKFRLDILPADFGCLEYLSKQASDIQSLVIAVSLLDEENSKRITLREHLRAVSMDNLSILIPKQRVLLIYIWFYIVRIMEVNKFRTIEPLVKILSFQVVLKHNILQRYCCIDPRNFFWIEVNIGKTHIDQLFRLLDHHVTPQTILDMELMVSTHHLESDRVISEKVCIRDLLGMDDPLLPKIHNNQFRIVDLLSIGRRIYDVVLAGLENDMTLRFKKEIQQNQKISSKITKILTSPLEILHQSVDTKLISIDKLYLLESKRMAGTFPVTLCSFILSRDPFKLATLLLLTPDKFLAVLQNTESLRIVYKHFDVDYIAASVPFLRQLIDHAQYDIVGERVRLVLTNTLIIDCALEC